MIKGGPNVGQNLALLGAYYPGYSVTWRGSMIGFGYGALTGAVLGWSVATFYNLLSEIALELKVSGPRIGNALDR